MLRMWSWRRICTQFGGAWRVGYFIATLERAQPIGSASHFQDNVLDMTQKAELAIQEDLVSGMCCPSELARSPCPQDQWPLYWHCFSCGCTAIALFYPDRALGGCLGNNQDLVEQLAHNSALTCSLVPVTMIHSSSAYPQILGAFLCSGAGNSINVEIGEPCKKESATCQQGPMSLVSRPERNEGV